MREVPFETMYVEWTVRRMVDHFERSGFSVYTDTVQEIAEAQVPLDRILGVSGKEGVRVFAFQFKAPEIRRGCLVWRVASSAWRAQLDLLREARHRGWIWYALPFFTDHHHHMHALHLCHFVPPATLCNKAMFIAWNGEVLFHFPCVAPRDLACSELPFAVGSHSGNVDLFERTIEVRPRARQVCADPLLNVKESWGTLLQRMDRAQFGLVVRRPEDLLEASGDPPNHPLSGSGCALAFDTIHRVVSVVSLTAELELAKDDLEQHLYLIALFDVLGFSNLVLEKGSKVILDIYQKLIEMVIHSEGYTAFGRVKIGSNYTIGGSYNIEKNQKWVGATLGAAFFSPELRDAVSETLVVPLFCEHFKEGTPLTSPYLTLDWVARWKSKDYPDPTLTLEKLREKAPEEKRVYYDNTIKFVDYTSLDDFQTRAVFLRSKGYRINDITRVNLGALHLLPIVLKVMNEIPHSGFILTFPEAVLTRKLRALFDQKVLFVNRLDYNRMIEYFLRSRKKGVAAKRSWLYLPSREKVCGVS